MAASVLRCALKQTSQKLGTAASSRSLASAAVAQLQRYPDVILHAPETEVTSLANGVRIATEEGSGELASLSIAVESGTRFETAGINGTSALLKELAFAGQANKIAEMGGRFSAEVGREATVFKATVARGDVKAALDVLAKAARGAAANSANVQAAKGAVLCELEGSRSRAEDYIFDHLHDAAFLDSTMGLPTLGTPESVSGLTAEGIAAFVAQQYTPARTVVSAAGAVEHTAVADAVSSLLGISSSSAGSSSSSGKREEVELPVATFVGSDKRMRFDSKPLAHVAFAFQGASATSEYALPLQLLQSVMGAWDRRSGIGADGAARWTIALGEHDIAHTAAPFSLNYKDTGLFGVYGVCPDISLDNFMWFTLENLVRMCHKTTDEEVARAKVALKTNLMLTTATTEGACEDISRQVIGVGRRVPAAELFARIDALSTADVRATANKFINDQDHALAAVGPIYELPDYNWIRRRSYWLRY